LRPEIPQAGLEPAFCFCPGPVKRPSPVESVSVGTQLEMVMPQGIGYGNKSKMMGAKPATPATPAARSMKATSMAMPRPRMVPANQVPMGKMDEYRRMSGRSDMPDAVPEEALRQSGMAGGKGRKA
jgi:hypothetical protein